MTREELLAEGVLEIGAVIGSILFVRTRARVFLTHATWLPRRELDAYAVKMIAHRLEQGEALADMVSDFSVNTPVLTAALRAAGYKPETLAWNANTRAAYKASKQRWSTP